jgi:hypothetical protein
MAELNRRAFLARSSLLAAAAGAAAVVPGVLTTLSADAPEIDATASDAAAADSGAAANAGEPLVAYVRDLSTGEVGVMNGLREVIVRDPGLANSILRAAR